MKKVLSIISTFLILLVAIKISAQTDSLLTQRNLFLDQLNREQSDSQRMEIFYFLAQIETRLSNLDQAMTYTENSLTLAQKISNSRRSIDNLLLLAHLQSLKKQEIHALKYYFMAISVLEKEKENLLLAQVNEQVGMMYFGMDIFDKAADYFHKSFLLASRLSDTTLMADMEYKIAICYKRVLEYDKALQCYQNSYVFYKILKNEHQVIEVLKDIAYIYKQQKKYQEGINVYLEIREILRNNSDMVSLNDVINNLGYLYVYLEDYEKARFAFQQTLMIDDQLMNPPDYKARTYINLAVCYQHENDFDNCQNNFQRALKLYKSSGNQTEIANTNLLIATIYIQKDDLYNAEVFCSQAIEAAKKANNPETLQVCYRTYASIMQGIGEYEKSIQYYQLQLGLRDSLLVEQRLKEQKLGEKQYELEKSEKELKLMIADEEMKDLALKQMKLEAEKRERELELLKRDNEVQELEKQRALQSLILARQQHDAIVREQAIKSLEQEKEINVLALKQKETEEKERQQEIELLQNQKEKQQLQIDKQNEEKKRFKHTSILFTLIFILILVSFIITKKKNHVLSRQKLEILQKNQDLQMKNEEIITQKEQLEEANEEISSKNDELFSQNEEIIRQSEIIEKKNKDITDSILYAKRIQTALFPPENYLDEMGLDHFILFQPKDIVSGDFYWIKKFHNYLFVVVADCTGHGVPGAFMSMLGISYLNEIIMIREITNAHTILNELRINIKNALRQTGKFNEAKDGMDITFCRINLNDLTLQYAGANNSLYHFHKNEGGYHLKEYKADPMPIGIYFKEKESFTLNESQLQKGDTLYLFTDGYFDQFGGDNGRKFLSKNFKSLLLSIQDKSLQEQGHVLEKTRREWQGNFEQIDDITILGIQI